jgi:hypothetical protein
LTKQSDMIVQRNFDKFREDVNFLISNGMTDLHMIAENMGVSREAVILRFRRYKILDIMCEMSTIQNKKHGPGANLVYVLRSRARVPALVVRTGYASASLSVPSSGQRE